MQFGLFLVVFIAVMAGNLWLQWKLRRDDAFLREYVRTSPKAALWRYFLGEERTAELIRTVFLPLGLVMWIVLVPLFIVASVLADGR